MWNALPPAPSLKLKQAGSSAHLDAQGGFTLIELTVSISIMLLLVGGGIASFVTFNDRQTLTSSAKQLITQLRSAQVKARNGDKPVGCDKLEGYTVVVTRNNPVVALNAKCDNVPSFPRDTFNLPTVISPTADAELTFLVLHGGVSQAQTINLYSATTGTNYRIEVTPGGEIKDLGIIAN